MIFTGSSGQRLDIWLECFNIQGLDIYLDNVVRCRPPANETPVDHHVKMCRRYLRATLLELTREYKTVVLFLLGSTAIKGLTGMSFARACNHQGELLSLKGWPQVPTYFTRHPAYTLPFRNPQAARAVYNHLTLVANEFLGKSSRGGYRPGPPNSPRDTRVLLEGGLNHVYCLTSSPPPSGLPMGLDIESFPIGEMYHDGREAPEQRFFHPLKSMEWSGVAREDLVQLVSLSWEDNPGKVGGSISTMTYRFWREEDRTALWEAIDNAKSLVFKNGKFDLSYLLSTPREWGAAEHLHPGVIVEDVETYLYLWDDTVERSLKALAPLLGLPGYGKEGGFKRHPVPDAPEALEYVAKDARDTLYCRNILLERIAEEFGPSSLKLSETTRLWYSRLTWVTVGMSLKGVPMDHRGLKAYGEELSKELEELKEEALGADLILEGKGSPASILSLVTRVVKESNLISHPDLQITPKKGEVSTAEDNIRFITENLDSSPETERLFFLLLHFRGRRKLLGTYVRPLVGPWEEKWTKATVRAKRSALLPLGGTYRRAHPSWFIVPSGIHEGDTRTGGTIQARITCKDPGLQTCPPSILQFILPQRRGTGILYSDYSQLELRVAAIVSGDLVLVAAFQEGRDLHIETTVEIYGEHILESPTFRSVERQVGKEANFLILYWGSPGMLRATLHARGIKVTKDFACQIVNRARARYHEYLASVTRRLQGLDDTGYLFEPILGQGRWMTTSRSTNWVQKSVVANTIVQAASANIMTCAMMQCQEEFRERSMEAAVIHNTYDSFQVEFPRGEMVAVKEITARHLENNWYYHRLLEVFNSKVPLEVETKITIRR